MTSETSILSLLEKSLNRFSRGLVVVLQEQKAQILSFKNMHEAYLDLIPILAQSNQLLLKREQTEDGLMKFTDMMISMQGETQEIMREVREIMMSTTGVLRSVNRLLEVNEKKSDEILNLLKHMNQGNDDE